MPQRILKHCHGVVLDYAPYGISWLLIWASDIPEEVTKLLMAVGTGFGLALGKWAWEKIQKRLKL
jgi:hypothetical protein